MKSWRDVRTERATLPATEWRYAGPGRAGRGDMKYPDYGCGPHGTLACSTCFSDDLTDAPETTLREEMLLEAAQLITGDRNQTYGSPTQNFTDTARVWSILLRPKLGEGKELEPGDVAMMMVALKLCRMVAAPKRDNWVDVAGYAGCGYEADVESGRIVAEDTTT